MEYGETVDACASREVLEETGLTVHSFRSGPYTNDIFESENKHYVTLFVVAASDVGEPEVLEPNKCEGWDWFAWSQLPEPLFPPLRTLVLSGYTPSEAEHLTQ